MQRIEAISESTFFVPFENRQMVVARSINSPKSSTDSLKSKARKATPFSAHHCSDLNSPTMVKATSANDSFLRDGDTELESKLRQANAAIQALAAAEATSDSSSYPDLMRAAESARLIAVTAMLRCECTEHSQWQQKSS